MNKKILIATILLMVFTSLIGYHFKNKSYNENNKFLATQNTSTKEKFIKEKDLANLSKDEQKAFENKKVKIDKLYADTESDIVQSFDINRSLYTKIILKDFHKFSVGKISGFSDTLFCREILMLAQGELNNIPKGAVQPFILVNNNKMEFIFAYKDKDGNNIVKKYIKSNNNSSWVKESDISKKGKKIFVE